MTRLKSFANISRKLPGVGFAFIFCLLAVSGCGSFRQFQEERGILDWKYSDLRLLDPVDTDNPSQDIIASYSRLTSNSLQLRLDFLDLGDNLDSDIYIPIDTGAGGNDQLLTIRGVSLPIGMSWDYLLEVTANGVIRLLDQHYSSVKAQLFIIYDSKQDRIVIDILSSRIPLYYGQTGLQVIVTGPNRGSVHDLSSIFHLDEPSPGRAQVALAFWNTFSAVSPAQTLRSWAGAHSGPMSSRHGLKYLLAEAERTQTPVALLDFSSAQNWSALEYLGVYTNFENIVSKGIVSVGALDYVDVEKMFLYFGKKSNFSVGGIDYAHYQNLKSSCSLLPSTSNVQFSEGISLDCKKLLLDIANLNPPYLLMLGGDFSNSAFGSPAGSTEIFSYFASHPWIQVKSLEDFPSSSNLGLVAHPYRDGKSSDQEKYNDEDLLVSSKVSSTNSSVVYFDLLKLPKNNVSSLAIQAYNTLVQSDTKELEALRSNYIGQLGELIAVAKWAENPIDEADCNRDLDYDGTNECVLSNEKLFAIIEPDGGYIPFVFSRDSLETHQIIGPTWEFIVGLSDPSIWDINSSVRGDPSQVLGAFQDPFTNWSRYQPIFSNDTLVLTNDAGTVTKSFSLSSNVIHVGIHAKEYLYPPVQVPLIIDPWFRFTPQWGKIYQSSRAQGAFYWGVKGDVTVEIGSDTNLDGFAFNDTYVMMSKPEDPNYDYPPGHYLPYPMALVQVQAAGNVSIDISVIP